MQSKMFLTSRPDFNDLEIKKIKSNLLYICRLDMCDLIKYLYEYIKREEEKFIIYIK